MTTATLTELPTPVYRRRIDMDRISSQVVAREFDGLFDAALQKALASAR